MITNFLRTRLAALVGCVICCVSQATAEPFPETSSDQEGYIERFADAKFGMTDNPSYAELDEYAKHLRELAAAGAAYERALETFYGHLGIGAMGSLGSARLTRWREKSPNSPSPVLSAAASRYVMTAGDLKFALASNGVWHEKPHAKAEFELIRSELLSTKNFASEDPYWYTLLAEMTVALRRDLSELDAIVTEGLQRHPTNFNLVTTAAAGYLSKWQGSSERLEAYAQKVVGLSRPEDGLANYARIYNVALRAQYGAQLFDLSKVNWQLLMRGARELLEQSRTDQHLNEVAVIACVGGNRALAREALVHPKFRYSDIYWYNIGTEYHPYKLCRHWAGQQRADTPAARRTVPIANP